MGYWSESDMGCLGWQLFLLFHMKYLRMNMTPLFPVYKNTSGQVFGGTCWIFLTEDVLGLAVCLLTV